MDVCSWIHFWVYPRIETLIAKLSNTALLSLGTSSERGVAQESEEVFSV